jgi:hypothetical protein
MGALAFLTKKPAAQWPPSGWPEVSTTFDPVNKGDNTILSGGNLVATCGNPQSVARSIGTMVEGSKTIFEFTHTSDTWTPEEEAYCRFGFGPDANLNLGVGQETSLGLAVQNDGSVLYNGGGIPGFPDNLPVGFVPGDTITLELERSNGDGIVVFYKNGVVMGTRTMAMSEGPWYAIVSNTVPIFAGTYTANFLGPYQIYPKPGYGPITES